MERKMKRRQILKMIGSSPIVLVGVPNINSVMSKSLNLDINDKKNINMIYRKLNYTYDNRTIYWFLDSLRSGMVDTQFKNFWNMNVGFISKVRNLENERYKVKTMTAIFYTDPNNNKIINKFRNPFTGRIVNVKQPSLRVSTRTYGLNGYESNRPKNPNYKTTEYGQIGPVKINGDDIWCESETGFRAEPLNNSVRMRQINDWFTFHGSLKELQNPETKCAQATQIFRDFNTWPDWLEMGDHPGNYVSYGYGRKVSSINDMPILWKKCMKDLYPKEFNNHEEQIG